MACVYQDPDGYRIIYYFGKGQRRALRFGSMPKRYVEAIAIHVEELVAAKLQGRPVNNSTARWLGDEASEFVLTKLAAVGLIKPKESTTLGPFLESYIGGRKDVKPATATVYGHTQRNLLEYFGADKPLRDITQGDADNWRLWLMSHKNHDRKVCSLAPNTVRRRCGIAKQFFRAALRSKLIEANPFADLDAVVKGNKAKSYFLSLEDAHKVLDACPDAQWRLLFALSRFAGLRCPSEHLGLRWSDVDWKRNRMLVRSPKTEHHEGGESRQIPIFETLRLYLEAVWNESPKDAEFVITRYRGPATNLRTQLLKIIGRAGLTPWPKLWQNLRATCETELAAKHPSHVVCAWIGHTRAVAMEHYLTVTDADFDAASARKDEARLPGLPSLPVKEASPGVKVGAQGSETEQNRTKPANAEIFPTLENDGNFTLFPVLVATGEGRELGVTGLELLLKTRGKLGVRQKTAQNPAHSAHGKRRTERAWLSWSMLGLASRKGTAKPFSRSSGKLGAGESRGAGFPSMPAQEAGRTVRAEFAASLVAPACRASGRDPSKGRGGGSRPRLGRRNLPRSFPRLR